MTSNLSRLFSSLALFGLALSSGCDEDDASPAGSNASDPSDPEAAERGRLSKADGLSGSCNLRCGAEFNPAQSCQCDSECLDIGDCCGDYVVWCEPDEEPPTPGTCNLRCGAEVDFSYTCQCDDDCAEFGDCCDDYGALCDASDE